jgi:hypothetical protein
MGDVGDRAGPGDLARAPLGKGRDGLLGLAPAVLVDELLELDPLDRPRRGTACWRCQHA